MTSDDSFRSYIILFALCTVFLVFVSSWSATGITVSAWDEFEAAVNRDPLAGPIPSMTYPIQPCPYGETRDPAGICQPVGTGEDCTLPVLCEVIAFGDAVASAVSWVFTWIGFILEWFIMLILNAILFLANIIIWFFTILFSFFRAVISLGVNGFGGETPPEINTMFKVIFIPFLAMVFLMIMRLVRGTGP